jgi:HEAT repeat protein
MPDLIWNFDELVRFTKWDDAEVRHWAIDRLVRHYPTRCCDAIADYLLDEHESTPTMVARHLGRHGDPSHHAILTRAFRLLRGVAPGHCIQALARLGYPGTVELAASASKRPDLTEAAQATVVEALAELGTPEARDLARDMVFGKTELLAEPPALRGILRVVEADEIPEVLSRFLAALRWRGNGRAGDGFRTLMDALQIDDAAWCFRTGPSGRIELRKTIKAVESGYDCDILESLGEQRIRQVARRFRAGDLADTLRSLAEWTRAAVERLPEDPEDDLPARIAAAVEAFSDPAALQDVRRPDHQLQQWTVGFQLSAAFAVARYRNMELSLKRARGNLERLLSLAEVETAFVLPDLPSAIAVVCRDNEERTHRAQDWCLRMLEAQGPFFPKVVALETLGELRAVHFISEIVEYLSDENSYVYGAAERVLSKMGEAIVGPVRARLEAGAVEPEAAHSLLILLCDLGTRSAYEAVVAHLDWFMEEVGPGSSAEWISLFGSEELIEPLRDWLDEDPAMVGQALLLLGAIHNVRIPEEEEILQAIENERARQAMDTDDGHADGPEQGGGDYVM